MRVYNFSAGPSCLPEDVLTECSKEMLDYNGTGQSVMEMSHRSSDFKPIIEGTEALVRKLMKVPDNYKVLFLQGGASTQFAMVPINLALKTKRAAYIKTGVWAKKAIAEARALGVSVDVVASSEDKNFTYIPYVESIKGDYDYAHITFNNTIMGTHYSYIPDTGNIPLVADISSCILSEPLDISRFGIVYAGAQKNLAPAGVTLVIIRDDLVSKEALYPTMLCYKTHVDGGSMFNTPPCYNIYVMGKVLSWIDRLGGVEAMKERNLKKAGRLYGYLDGSDYYHATVTDKTSRSLMNIPFLTRESDPDKAKAVNAAFVKGAREKGLVNLAGHRLVGGMRASIYNAMPIEGVEALIAYMDSFAKANS